MKRKKKKKENTTYKAIYMKQNQTIDACIWKFVDDANTKHWSNGEHESRTPKAAYWVLPQNSSEHQEECECLFVVRWLIIHSALNNCHSKQSRSEGGTCGNYLSE